MNGRKDNTLWYAGVIVGSFLWAILIRVKVDTEMPTLVFVLLSVLAWLPLLVHVCIVLAPVIVRPIAKLKRWHRRRKNDRRIIAQAKVLEVWDKNPIVLGGRALELKAWKDFKIKREPGETDKDLRRRCMTAADEELANTLREGERENDRIHRT